VSKSSFSGALFKDGPCAALVTDQPLSLTEYGALMRRAGQLSGTPFGKVTVTLVESPQFPDKQGITVKTEKPCKEGAFERLVRDLFNQYELKLRWHGHLPRLDAFLVAVVDTSGLL